MSAAAGLAECYALSGCLGSVGYGLRCSSTVVTSATGSIYDCEGYRLPTEAEWEYAARAGTDLLYAGSDTVGEVAWYDGNSDFSIHPVATKLPNAWGLYDMSGNVWEWTWDWYQGNYYVISPCADPEGPASGFFRVRRGGGWHDAYASYAHVTDRALLSAFDRSSSLGFRISRTIP